VFGSFITLVKFNIVNSKFVDLPLDNPVDNPDNDLLGMVAYADQLANFVKSVKPPFTIGIYGEWGVGKTSFVSLLKSCLTSDNLPASEEITFITFTAWPYKTADELWRALILKIAQELYGIKTDVEVEDGKDSQTENKGNDLLSSLAEWLTSDALVLYEEPSEPNPSEEYDELIAKLDSTLAGSISKSPEQKMNLNQEESLLALVKVTVAALSTLSPLMLGFRTLFGLDTQIEPAKLLQRGKNEVTRERIESMQEFRRVFRQLFHKRASQKRVCIFLDDLDRCTPDIALDLLEATKIFLGEVPCIFIVAADEHLIGQGLRLRYKDLMHESGQGVVQAFFSQKGQEYFEKIIQMGIRVPEQTNDQTHKFITAQYPAWISTTDIIRTVIGANPRRIKQYCNLLKYKYSVAQQLDNQFKNTDD
jgi:KAP family P-loop domain